VNMNNKPVLVLPVQTYLQNQLAELVDNDSIFDQFQCAISGDGAHFVTGTYSNCFLLYNSFNKTSVTVEARDDVRQPQIVDVQHPEIPPGPKHRGIIRNTSKSDSQGNHSKMAQPPNFQAKVLRVAWHPRLNAVAVAGLYKLYLYQTK